MAQSQAELVKALVDAGVHFGHRVSRWNPKMEPYIIGKRNMIHIIDVRETLKGLLRAKKLVQQTVAGGKDVLFVGTKRQAMHVVQEEAKRCGMHYVSERWLGGTLTNFRTIRARLNRLDELESLWETGKIETYSKKMKSTLMRERTKIQTNLEGIRKMERIPGVMVIVDTRREHIAVKEAHKLGVKTVALIDTDSDPDLDRPAHPRQRRRDARRRNHHQGTRRFGDRRQNRPPGNQRRRAASAPASQHPGSVPRRGDSRCRHPHGGSHGESLARAARNRGGAAGLSNAIESHGLHRCVNRSSISE